MALLHCVLLPRDSHCSVCYLRCHGSVCGMWFVGFPGHTHLLRTCNHLAKEDRADCITLIVPCVLVSLLYGDMAWSVICDCSIFWSYSCVSLFCIANSISNSYTRVCPPVHGDNPRALARGLSHVQVDTPCSNYFIPPTSV